MTHKSVLERAFELAHGGEVTTMTELREKLKAEGYMGLAAHFEGKAIRDQLTKAMRHARSNVSIQP